MALSKSRSDKEDAKFVECPTGKTSVRTCIANPIDDPVNVSGGSSVAGQTDWLTTTVDIDDTATAIPVAGPLTNRNSITILNTDLVETVFIGPTSSVSATSAEGTDFGVAIPLESKENIDLDATATIFAIAPTGKTIRIQITEYARA